MLDNGVKAGLIALVAAGVRILLSSINVTLDDAVYVAIATGIVTYFLGLLTYDVAKSLVTSEKVKGFLFKEE